MLMKHTSKIIFFLNIGIIQKSENISIVVLSAVLYFHFHSHVRAQLKLHDINI